MSPGSCPNASSLSPFKLMHILSMAPFGTFTTTCLVSLRVAPSRERCLLWHDCKVSLSSAQSYESAVLAATRQLPCTLCKDHLAAKKAAVTLPDASPRYLEFVSFTSIQIFKRHFRNLLIFLPFGRCVIFQFSGQSVFFS